MSIRSTLGATALVAAAFALAACGSDKSAGPTTANNEQIIAEMRARLDSSEGLTFVNGLGFQFAIAALASGAPVNAGNVTIDGQSYRFNTTVASLEMRDSTSGALVSRMSILVGWRNTTGDSVFIAMYAPDGEVFTDRRAPAALMRLPGAGRSSLAELGAILHSGHYTISRDISAGPDTPAIFGLGMGEAMWIASSDDGINSGSMSYAAASGACDATATEEYGYTDEYDSCQLVRANASVSALMEGASESDTLEVTFPAQTVVGVTLVDLIEPV